MKVVTPFRPFAPESRSHRQLGNFDWLDAVSMLRASVTSSCGCQTILLTDGAWCPSDAQTYAYPTDQTRLMLWLLDVAVRYLESDDFNDDTIWLSPDTLVFEDLRGWFRADLGLMVRTGLKYHRRPLLNGAQVWRVAAKDRLIGFYRSALALGVRLDEKVIRWGADTLPLVTLLEPLRAGLHQSGDLSVYGFEAITHFRSISGVDMDCLKRRQVPARTTPIVDFKDQRKRMMRDYFELAAFGVTACA